MKSHFKSPLNPPTDKKKYPPVTRSHANQSQGTGDPNRPSTTKKDARLAV